MPHVTDGTKDKVHETKRPVKEGELCFLFSEAILKEYNKEPRWSSIHKIKVAMNNPYHTEWSHLVILEYMTGYSRLDVQAAADLAFFEFYRIVGARYEDGMILQNGNAFKGAKIPSLGEHYTVDSGKDTAPKRTAAGVVGFQTVEKRKPGRPKKEVDTNV